MAALNSLIFVFDALLTPILRLFRTISWILLALMVCTVIFQVVMRYVFNAAQSWPEEAARFMMLWLTGLMAPSAYRWGGFVAIDMVKDMLPKRVGAILALFLLVVSLCVLIVGFQFGLKHVASGWLFNSASLRIPMEMFGMGLVRIKLAWMYMSLVFGIGLMIIVNMEAIMRNVAALIDPTYEAPRHQDQIDLATE